MKTKLFEAIEKAVSRRKEAIVDAYLNKIGFEAEESYEEVEFDKQVMVEVEGVWYRCNVRFFYSESELYDEGDYLTPPSWDVNQYYSCHIMKVVVEKTKEEVKKYAA